MPLLAVRTDGEEWRVINTVHTGWAAKTPLREQHNELDLEPLSESTKFRKASHILFVSMRDEPQIVRLHLPFGNVSVLELKTDGRHWVTSFSKINGRQATGEQKKANEHAIPLSVSGDIRVIPPLVEV